MPIRGSFAGASARAYGLGAGGAALGDFESIQTITAGSTVANIEFTSIPQTYSHLQIRGITRDNIAAVANDLYIQFNADTAANYSFHFMRGDGANVVSSAGASTTVMLGVNASANATSGVFCSSVIDILDYANTNKYKTIKLLAGWDNNGSGGASMWSGNWRSTNGITSIKLFPNGGSFLQYSSFALYGVKA
jgi:hypothetical protein